MRDVFLATWASNDADSRMPPYLDAGLTNRPFEVYVHYGIILFTAIIVSTLITFVPWFTFTYVHCEVGAAFSSAFFSCSFILLACGAPARRTGCCWRAC